MKFSLSDSSTFEIPDHWLNECGMTAFSPATSGYLPRPLAEHLDHPVTLMPIKLIKPLRRASGVTLDFGGFGEDRMRRILQWIAQGTPIEPIQVTEQHNEAFPYAIYDGFHRFHAAVAAGFSDIPVAIGKWGFSWDT